LKRRTTARSAGEKPPAFIVRHRSPSSPTKAAGLPLHASSRSVKADFSGSSPTDWANMQKMQRIRKLATCGAAWRFSSARASFASSTAISRVTATRLRAGSSACGSRQIVRSRSRMSGRCRSAR